MEAAARQVSDQRDHDRSRDRPIAGDLSATDAKPELGAFLRRRADRDVRPRRRPRPRSCVFQGEPARPGSACLPNGQSRARQRTSAQPDLDDRFDLRDSNSEPPAFANPVGPALAERIGPQIDPASASGLPPIPDPARCLLAIREARTALAKSPDDWIAYRILNEAYRNLMMQEAGRDGGNTTHARKRQSNPVRRSQAREL